MRLHLVSLPHTQVSPQFCGCAYTGKVLKFCKMMKDWNITLYAPEGPAVDWVNLIPCLSNSERIKIFGADNPARLPDWPTDAQTAQFNANVILALSKRYEKGDLVLLSAGRTHLPIRDALPQALFCEPFVGYEGILTNFCAFESYAWLHYIYGKYKIENIRWYDTVVTPYADPEEFPQVNTGNGEYLAFLGRRIERKGLHVAGEIAKAANMPLRVAGSGELTIKGGGDVEYVGPLNVAQRADFLANARALLMPTIYCEPGGNVAIEAMMCGTPVICPDFGIMSETVKHGETGFHFRVLSEALAAVQNLGRLDRWNIRRYAFDHFSLRATAPKFSSWFKRLGSLWGDGWYAVDNSAQESDPGQLKSYATARNHV